ncbi:MAG TPA: hypothetical protein VNN79_14675 [Actinomycetota bacterium]|nr:hypothetical protein [Actinomycetota bacterium]
MTAYLIVHGKDHTDRLAAHAFPDRAAANAGSLPASGLVPRVPPAGPAGGCAYLVETVEDVVRSPLAGRLVAIYNGLARGAQHVNRFESRAVGAQRLLALLKAIAQPPPVATEKKMPDIETNGRRGRKPKYQPDQIIEVLANDRQLKPGKKNTMHLAQLLALPNPITVRAALEAGVPSSYLHGFFVPKGFIRVLPLADGAE